MRSRAPAGTTAQALSQEEASTLLYRFRLQLETTLVIEKDNRTMSGFSTLHAPTDAGEGSHCDHRWEFKNCARIFTVNEAPGSIYVNIRAGKNWDKDFNGVDWN
jgi:hypothetical protein